MSIIIRKETVQRLLKDVRHIMKHPLTDQGIYYVHDEKDMMKGYAMIVGPSETPYAGGFYFFQLHFPADYPFSPPKVKFCTNGNNIRFNPNLYPCGKVCISLLNTWQGEQWTSCQTISSILLTLCTLLCVNPLLNEPGVIDTHPDMEKYNRIVEFANIDIAVCDIVMKTKGVYSSFFNLFLPHIKDNFEKHYDHHMQLAQSHVAANENPYRLVTSAYGMKVVIDFKMVAAKLEACKSMLADI